MHHGKSHLNQKLPKSPAPACTKCKATMNSVKIVDQSQTPQGVAMTCTARCSVCGTNHLGKRYIQVKGNHMAFGGQSFDPAPSLPGSAKSWMVGLTVVVAAVVAVITYLAIGR